MKHCLHCDEKSYDDDFCCLGCKTAYKIINNLGFNKYYQLKNSKEAGLIKPDLERQIDVTNFAIKNNDQTLSIKLAIQGLHCAACVWLIENILKKNSDVITARINLTQKSLFLRWQGNLDNFYKITKIIQEIGYKLLPLDPKIIDEEDKKYDRSLFVSMAVAGFGAGNLMLLSFALWFATGQEMGYYTRNLLHFFSGLIALPVIIYAGQPFFKSAIKSIKAGYPNMDLVISIAIILTTIASLIKTFLGAEHIYFDSAVMLIFFLLVGRFLEQKVRKKAFSVANEFTLLNAGFGRVEIDNKISILPTKDLKKGMILLVTIGEKIAADGEIIEGFSAIDNSIINGESQAQNVKIGDKVFAGTINLNNPLKILITAESNQSLLSKIIELTQNIDYKKNSYIKIADKLAKFYIPITHFLAFITFYYWFFYLNSPLDQAFSNAIAVLIITCPCALALAIPIVQTILTSKMLKKGIVIKSGQAIEKLPKISTIIFDKTGSITLGKPVLQNIFLFNNNSSLKPKDRQKYLQIAASLCKNSSHPLSKAIVSSYDKKLLNIKTIEKKGEGLIGSLENKKIYLGKADFCKIKNFQEVSDNSNLNFYMNYDNQKLIFTFSDDIKSDAISSLNILKKLNKKIILLSGDNQKNVEKIANKLEIKEFYSNQSPINKANFLKKLQAKNETFLMVGDGINDAPSLAMADISLSFNQASDLAQNISDIVIQGQKLMPIIDLLLASKKAVKIMRQNLAISLFYNSIAIPFAMMGYVVPLFAALAMSSSSILVLLNSLRASTKPHLL